MKKLYFLLLVALGWVPAGLALWGGIRGLPVEEILNVLFMAFFIPAVVVIFVRMFGEDAPKRVFSWLAGNPLFFWL